jgi:hypothetical protein
MIPCSPCKPVAPGAPSGPAGPCAPATPWTPGVPAGPRLPAIPCEPGCPDSPRAPGGAAAPAVPATPSLPSAPFWGLRTTNFRTLGESRSKVIAPFAICPVWIRPVASAVPPATTTNVTSAQVTVIVVRTVSSLTIYGGGRPTLAGHAAAKPLSHHNRAGTDRQPPFEGWYRIARLVWLLTGQKVNRSCKMPSPLPGATTPPPTAEVSTPTRRHDSVVMLRLLPGRRPAPPRAGTQGRSHPSCQAKPSADRDADPGRLTGGSRNLRLASAHRRTCCAGSAQGGYN